MTEPITNDIRTDEHDRLGDPNPVLAPVPDGYARLTDILGTVRYYAENLAWCNDAERVIRATLNEGLEFRPDYDFWCCEMCQGMTLSEWRTRPDLADVRFTPVDGTPEFVSLLRLKLAIRDANRDYDGHGPRRLYAELVVTYGLDDVPEPATDELPACPDRFTITGQRFRFAVENYRDTHTGGLGG